MDVERFNGIVAKVRHERMAQVVAGFDSSVDAGRPPAYFLEQAERRLEAAANYGRVRDRKLRDRETVRAVALLFAMLESHGVCDADI